MDILIADSLKAQPWNAGDLPFIVAHVMGIDLKFSHMCLGIIRQQTIWPAGYEGVGKIAFFLVQDGPLQDIHGHFPTDVGALSIIHHPGIGENN